MLHVNLLRNACTSIQESRVAAHFDECSLQVTGQPLPALRPSVPTQEQSPPAYESIASTLLHQMMLASVACIPAAPMLAGARSSRPASPLILSTTVRRYVINYDCDRKHRICMDICDSCTVSNGCKERSSPAERSRTPDPCSPT